MKSRTLIKSVLAGLILSSFAISWGLVRDSKGNRQWLLPAFPMLSCVLSGGGPSQGPCQVPRVQPGQGSAQTLPDERQKSTQEGEEEIQGK